MFRWSQFSIVSLHSFYFNSIFSFSEKMSFVTTELTIRSRIPCQLTTIFRSIFGSIFVPFCSSVDLLIHVNRDVIDFFHRISKIHCSQRSGMHVASVNWFEHSLYLAVSSPSSYHFPSIFSLCPTPRICDLNFWSPHPIEFFESARNFPWNDSHNLKHIINSTKNTISISNQIIDICNCSKRKQKPNQQKKSNQSNRMG